MNEEKWEKYEKEIEPKMDKLYRNKQFLELVFFMSTILEEEIKDVILLYETQIEKLLTEYQLEFSINKFLKRDRMTLGDLRRYLSVYYGGSLLNEIEEFNKLRIKVVHRIFDYDVCQLEKEIKNFYPQRIFKLLYELVNLRIELLDLNNKILKLYVSRLKKSKGEATA